jgi:hypothetical protein
MPSGLIASALENALRGSDHSFISAGIAFPSSRLSTPSRMIVKAVPATSSF